MPKMHLWPGLHPGPNWGSLQHFHRPLAGFKGPTSREGREEEKGREKEGREGEEKGAYRYFLFPTSSPGMELIEGLVKIKKGLLLCQQVNNSILLFHVMMMMAQDT